MVHFYQMQMEIRHPLTRRRAEKQFQRILTVQQMSEVMIIKIVNISYNQSTAEFLFEFILYLRFT